MSGIPFSRQQPCPGSGQSIAGWSRPVSGRLRALCPQCLRRIQVHADGTLWSHVKVYTINYPPVVDREPQPTDGPDYNHDHRAWTARQVEATP